MTRISPALRTVVVAAQAPDSVLAAGLLDAGCELVAVLAPAPCLKTRLAQLRPDLIVLDAAADALSMLAQVAGADLEPPRPVVVFTSDARGASIAAATAAGVCAYVVDGVRPGRVAAVLEVALARFAREQRLLAELADTRTRLAERKVIERAKGLLMARHQLGEDQAYQKLRSMAMNRKLKLAEVAQRVLDVTEFLK